MNDWSATFHFGNCRFVIQGEGRLEAENAALRHQLSILRGQGERAGPAHERWLVLYPAVSLVSVDPAVLAIIRPGDTGGLASSRLSRYWRRKSR
jgi:hypothetical protein